MDEPILGNPQPEAVKKPEVDVKKQKIRELLISQGWDLRDITKVWIDVDTKESDFKRKFFRTKKYDQSIAEQTDFTDNTRQYVDYLLLDKKGEPLAVVEYSESSKSLDKGKLKAKEYAEDIKRQTGNHVFIFYTNGNRLCFWDYPYETVKLVPTFYNQDYLERVKWANQNRAPNERVVISNEVKKTGERQIPKANIQDFSPNQKKGFFNKMFG
ncbi:hypothetical protein J4438_00315 [Candidatus Woesearchaeota archaeon]|nr:hypothetical protein [Candidatus Woesearchaeota archaeon]